MKLTSLVLQTGQIFYGSSFGADISISGEVVFQTGMVGYPESLTDPSYKGQILILTYPLIGNYGVSLDERDDNNILKYFESDNIQISGLICGEYVDTYNHWNSQKSLSEWLKENNIPAIQGIDTRELTKIIRNNGSILGIIKQNNLDNDLDYYDPNKYNLVEQVSRKNIKIYNPNGKINVLVIDCGIKNNQLRMLLKRDVRIKLVPYDYNFLQDLDIDQDTFTHIFISNGPGDPRRCEITIDNLRKCIKLYPNKSIFGICLGHQILSLAIGADIYKLKYGNRGHNVPCQLVGSEYCAITSQNHGYAVDVSKLPNGWKPLFVNANDGSNEGIYHVSKPYFGVQFHPEGKAGPLDTDYLFDIFLEGGLHEFVEIIQKNKCKTIIEKKRKVLILGSGALSIGQAGEFDYSGSQALKAYKEESIFTILINPNIATVQTSSNFVDKIYYLPLTYEFVKKVIENEHPDCISLSFGGQTALNCIAKGTPISLSNGTSRHIEELMDGDINVISPKQHNISVVYDISKKCETGIIQGKSNCIELTLFDGRTLICTPDHKILTHKGEWIKANDLNINVDKVSISPIETPLDKITSDEFEWSLKVGEKILTMRNSKERDITLAFARVLGILYSNGRITKYNKKSPDHIILVTKEIDRVVEDVKLLMDRIPNIYHKQSNNNSQIKHDSYVITIRGWTVNLRNLPGVMTLQTKRIGLENLQTDRKSSQKLTLPEFLDTAPIGVVREFLAALFGCDGQAPNIHKMDGQDQCHIKLMYISKEEFENHTIDYLKNIQKLLKKCNVNMKGSRITSKNKNNKFTLKDDYKRKDIHLHIPDSLSFAEKVGFRYCIQKQMRLAAACIIWRREYNAKEQKRIIAEKILKEKSLNPKISYQIIKEKVISKFKKENIVIDDEWISFPYPYRRELNILKQIGIEKWFDRSQRKTSQEDYNILKHDKVLPQIYLKIIGKRNVGEKQVYDLTVSDNHSFVASSVAVHNCGIELYNNKILEKFNIKILGTPIQTIIDTEDREKFKNRLTIINESCVPSITISNIDEGIKAAEILGYPVLVRAAFTLGGLGSGFVDNEEELIKLLHKTFSKTDQIIIDKSLKGWKEIEYEIVRDKYDNTISVCNMENIDPLGIHTGESIVVAPSQTLTDTEYNMLRSVAIKTVKSLGIIGECNIQYALDPNSLDYYIIEINARLSRSSALASKATGYPLAYIAAKLGLGYSLLELRNSVTKNTTACFEPSLDYCVIKIPYWDLKKFPMVDKTIGSSMKSVGEGMAISRNFEEAFQKAMRMTNTVDGFEPNIITNTDDQLENPSYDRILGIATALYSEKNSINDLHRLTKIDKWFLNKFQNIISMRKNLEYYGKNKSEIISSNTLLNAKKYGFSDNQISRCINSTEIAVRNLRKSFNIFPDIKEIDTVAGEFPCYTKYLYLTYHGTKSDIEFEETNNIIVLGSGVYKIGSSVEFDWCIVNTMRRIRELGYKSIMINCNPETVSTDYDEADRLYFDVVNFETTMDIYEIEKPHGIVLSMGGQIPNNIAMLLHRQNVKVIGTQPDMIDNAENRYKFSRMLDHINVDQPQWKELVSIEEAIKFCHEVNYPCLIRPSYVLSGASMSVAYSDKDLKKYLLNNLNDNITNISKDNPVVISKFILDAKEIEVDAVAKNGEVKLYAISEHVENAGTHSGDATLILPAQDLTEDTVNKIKTSMYKIAKELLINGPFNIQFIAKDDKIKVIECNLRASRSFPFVSKVLGINFIKCATDIMLNSRNDDKITINKNLIGVKVPKFSFDRLEGADMVLGVEMMSTGEVACFGKNHYEAYLKATIAAGLRLPRKNSKIFISIGSYKHKKEFLSTIQLMYKLGYKLYGSKGTTDFYSEFDVSMIPIIHDKIDTATIVENYQKNKFDLIINISMPNSIKISKNILSYGYLMRRIAIDLNIPLITDIKCAKLFIVALSKYQNGLTVQPYIDCQTSYKTIRLPGLIDVHVHVREPGHEYKEDWQSCTRSALAGGITTIFAMPNTNPAIIDRNSYEMVYQIAKKNAYCNYGIYLGASQDNSQNISQICNEVNAIGLKMYLNNTYGQLILPEISSWMDHIKNWNSMQPICVHAEMQTLAAIIHIANLYHKKLHICHVSKKEEIELVKESKKLGMDITCEVSPHHLFLNCENNNLSDNLKEVRPLLGKKEDQNSLWENLKYIDCFATDHAPHLLKDKITSCCPGFPGLETALPLLLTAVVEGRLTIEDIVLKYHDNPCKIFNIPMQTLEETYIEINLDKNWIIPTKLQETKCDWTPFEGHNIKGYITRVVLNKELVYIDGIVLNKKCGKIVIPSKDINKLNYNLNDNLNDKKIDKKINKKVYNKLIEEKSNDLKVNKKLYDIISVKQFDKDTLRSLFKMASDMKKRDKNNDLSLQGILNGKVIGSIFYEPSTRTSCSFNAAIQKLGGRIIEVKSDQSSVKKGESIEDFMKTMECYCNLLILRSSKQQDIYDAVKVIKIPLINAGNGDGEHPTQALLDMYTIREERGTINGLTITFYGDLKYSRTVHSLAILLGLYNVRINYISPKQLRMPQNLMDELFNKNIEQNIYDLSEIENILPKTDILYMTRIQKERFKSQEEYDNVIANGKYKLSPELLNKGKYNTIVMHPLPRVDEISPEVDNDPRAAYFRQMENGLYLRMALLSHIL